MNAELVSTSDLGRMIDDVARLSPAVDDADRVERIRRFEVLKAAIVAEQMAEAVRFAASQEEAQARHGVAAQRRSRGVASQLALARRISPWAAARWLGCARILISEMPDTFSELRAGRTSEWRAVLVARETAMLSRDDRATVDRELAPRLESLGDRSVEAEARKIAYRLDPQAAVSRARNAANDRCVSLRPAPDVMARLSVLAPMPEAVAAYAALVSHADSVIGTGEERRNADGTHRGRGQIMADTLLERITGSATAGDVDVEINLVVSEATLLGGDEPATVIGYGPIPAGSARALAGGRRADRGRRWLRRSIASADGRRLIAMESTRRDFAAAQRAFLTVRDQVCRTPWCDAPIRHADHIVAYADGGRTHVDNGQGLCEACNYAKQALGWSAICADDGTVVTRTPTGHVYRSRAPAPPGAGPSEVDDRTESDGAAA